VKAIPANFEPSDGMREAKRALALPKRKPTDADRPPTSTFTGPRARVLPGQLDLFGNESPSRHYDERAA
jgi:hypothetical protein